MSPPVALQLLLERLVSFQVIDNCRLGDKPIQAVTEDDLEAFVKHLVTLGRSASTRMTTQLSSGGGRNGSAIGGSRRVKRRSCSRQRAASSRDDYRGTRNVLSPRRAPEPALG